MTDQRLTISSSLAGLSKKDWLRAISDIATFESVQGIHALSELAQPLGWEMVKSQGWSHLCLASDRDTWFRERAVFGYFDRLIDDGFFDEFDTVVFYGAGPCAYAATAFSVAAPGARVLAIQPQATLDPRVTEWDHRFTDMRRTDFTSRYGYAPDMLDAAAEAIVLYDPHQRLDAMHTALFTRPNVVKYRMPLMGDALQTDLLEMELFVPILIDVAEGSLDAQRFAEYYRARRDYPVPQRDLADARAPLCAPFGGTVADGTGLNHSGLARANMLARPHDTNPDDPPPR